MCIMQSPYDSMVNALRRFSCIAKTIFPKVCDRDVKDVADLWHEFNPIGYSYDGEAAEDKYRREPSSSEVKTPVAPMRTGIMIQRRG
jgi:hypothetical protein